MSEPQDPLDRLLERWNPADQETAGLTEEIWRRIRRLEEPRARASLFSRLETRFARPALALLFVAACVLGVLFLRERRAALRQGQVNAELARQYLHRIDPLRDAQGPAGSLDRDLAWLRDELRLSPAQFARIREYHEASGPELSALAGEVARMRAESAVLEAKRRAADQVDFLAVARLAETRRMVDRECLDSTQRLVQAAAGVMTPEQRLRYLQYVQGALSPALRSGIY